MTADRALADMTVSGIPPVDEPRSNIARCLNWVVRAGENRPSRLHDYDGRRVPLRALSDVPIILCQGVNRRLLGRLPALPWIPYPAIRKLESIIKPNWHVLEFGSGNSTVWLAHRASRLLSVESDRRWYERIRPRLAQSADYRFVDLSAGPEAYWQIQEEDVNDFDLVIVDGLFRDQCMRSALRAVRPGGYIYLDNIDTDGRTALGLLQHAADAIEVVTGFPPAQWTVTTGILGRMP